MHGHRGHRGGRALRAIAAAAGLCAALAAGCGRQAPGVAAIDAFDSAATSQDLLPESWRLEPEPPVAASVPFADAAHERVAVYESVTLAGEPLELGTIEIPEGWRIVGSPASCPMRGPCLLWRAVSPDGRGEIALLAGQRESDSVLPPARLAASWLERSAPAREGTEVVDEGQVDAVAPVTRRRWSNGGAWRWLAHHALPEGPVHEWLALDVESGARGARDRDAQSGPLLRIRTPAGQFDGAAAQAVRASLRYRAEWFPSWWLAWERRQAGAFCERGLYDDLCHRAPNPMADFFQSPSSLGIWDQRGRRSEPPGGRYDP